MDELGKILQDLLNNPPSGGQDAAAQPRDAKDPPDPHDAQAPPALPDLSGLLGAVSAPIGTDNRKMQLLTALKPYLRPERREKIERAQSMLGTAYSVRGLLSSLGGVLHV